MKLSIITPFYNRDDHLEKTIKSALENCRDREDVELILINDGSTDNSLRVAQKYSSNYDQIHLISYSENKGVNYARNQGIKKARGSFITFLDSDDCLKKKSIEKVFEVIQEYEASHYLFLVSVNKQHKSGKYYYKDWVRGKLSGDFFHIVKSSILKEKLFFQGYSAYEELNWYRVIKETEPLYLKNIVLVEFDMSRSDHLSKRLQKKNLTQLTERLDANITFIKYYGKDIIRYAPQKYCKRILGIILTWARINSIKAYKEKKSLATITALLVSYPVILLHNWWKKLT